MRFLHEIGRLLDDVVNQILQADQASHSETRVACVSARTGRDGSPKVA
jgi:hypothetical protein